MNALRMGPDRWRRIAAILDLVLDRPPEERSAVLDEACVGDADLRAEVEAFLAADAEAGAFLDTPAGELAPELLAEAAEEEGEAENLAGHQVGRYRLLREIGGGGMGTVYEAEDAQLGRRVAVKILPPEYSRDRRAKERFLHEARAAAAVDHPNLCTVHDAGESEGRLYIVLSFYEGETLRDRIRRGPLPIAEAREIAIQVVRGLARAHEAGIVHRDIKPANVMLPRRGEAKILDFGIARLQGDEVSLTRTGASWGTPAYMSPEQARGEPVDARADVWSLGVMLYEMIAGRRPFGGESVETLVSSILTQEPEPLERIRPEIPPGLARVVDRALTKNPARRYSNAAELLADLESGRARGRRLSRRNALRVIFLTGALAVLGLLVFALWRWQFASGPPVRVAVLQPVVEMVGENPEVDLIASDVQRAVLAALVSLEGVQPLDPPERDEAETVEAGRLREADEALYSDLVCRESSCEATFRRRKPDGVILAVSEPFEIQGGFENAYALSEGVRVHVQQVYATHRLRPESTGISVMPEDYSEYAELQRRVDRGERLAGAELDQLDALLRRSHGPVGAYVLAAGIARNQGELDRALNYTVQAEKVAPYDPRPLFIRLRVQATKGQHDAVRETLERLANLAPGDPRVQAAEADLLEARGELRKAHGLRKEVVQRRPTWRNILKLATLEYRLGASEDAMQRLKELLEEQPDNQYVWESVVAVEATYGDLKRAAALYEKLHRTWPARAHLTNLGYVRFLLGDYAAAIKADRQALELEPHDLLTRFNLAIALEAQGNLPEARRLYGILLREFATALPTQEVHDRLLHVQCLARMNQREAASRLADEVLKEVPEDVRDCHLAAQAYALLREPIRALYYTELALKKGLSPEWFTCPEFQSLEDYPDFRFLLEQHGREDRKAS